VPVACSLDCEDRRGWGLLVQVGCNSCRPVHNVSVLSYDVLIASALCQGECRRHISSAPWCGCERPLCIVIRLTSARCSLITPSAHFFEPRQFFRPLVPAGDMNLSQPRVTPFLYQVKDWAWAITIWGSEVMRCSDLQGRYARSHVLSKTRVKAGMYVSLERESGT
jgi:hypothetical protein